MVALDEEGTVSVQGRVINPSMTIAKKTVIDFIISKGISKISATRLQSLIQLQLAQTPL